MKQEDKKKMQSLYELWLSSGQSRTSFAKSHGYSPSSFTYWVRKFQLGIEVSKKECGFSKLPVENSVSSSQALTVITYPCGKKIEFYVPVSALYLKEIAE